MPHPRRAAALDLIARLGRWTFDFDAETKNIALAYNMRVPRPGA